jgi:hypothetical protein
MYILFFVYGEFAAFQIFNCSLFVPSGCALTPIAQVNCGPNKELRDGDEGGTQIANENEALKEQEDQRLEQTNKEE